MAKARAKWGGRREGAGRTKQVDKLVRKTYSLDATHVEKAQRVSRALGDVGESAAVRHMIEAYREEDADA